MSWWHFLPTISLVLTLTSCRTKVFLESYSSADRTWHVSWYQIFRERPARGHHINSVFEIQRLNQGLGSWHIIWKPQYHQAKDQKILSGQMLGLNSFQLLMVCHEKRYELSTPGEQLLYQVWQLTSKSGRLLSGKHTV